MTGRECAKYFGDPMYTLVPAGGSLRRTPSRLMAQRLVAAAAVVGLAFAAQPLLSSLLASGSSGESALRDTPGLLAAETSNLDTVMSRSGLVLPGGLTVNSIKSASAKTIDGVQLYPNTGIDSDTAVQSLTNGSVRVLNIMRSTAAPTTFTYGLQLPTGGSALTTGDGGVATLSAAGEVVSQMPAPWAMDANNNPVPASYSVTGSTLTLTVAHSANVAYPVVADPWWSPFASGGKEAVKTGAAGCVSGAVSTVWTGGGAAVACGVGGAAGAAGGFVYGFVSYFW